jgi:hypothetical protein
MDTEEKELLIGKGTKVALPFGEQGIVTHIKDIPWGFQYEVIILYPKFNDLYDICDFKLEELTIIED